MIGNSAVERIEYLLDKNKMSKTELSNALNVKRGTVVACFSKKRPVPLNKYSILKPIA